MRLSRFLASLMGPTLIVLVAGMVLQRELTLATFDAPSLTTAMVIRLVGILLFVAGVAIVRVHNRWAADWTTLVTVMGWMCMLGGLVRVLAPGFQVVAAASFLQSDLLVAVWGVALFAIGCFLTVKGFERVKYEASERFESDIAA